MTCQEGVRYIAGLGLLQLRRGRRGLEHRLEEPGLMLSNEMGSEQSFGMKKMEANRIRLDFASNQNFSWQFQTSCDGFGGPSPWGLVKRGGGGAQEAPPPWSCPGSCFLRRVVPHAWGTTIREHIPTVFTNAATHMQTNWKLHQSRLAVVCRIPMTASTVQCLPSPPCPPVRNLRCPPPPPLLTLR